MGLSILRSGLAAAVALICSANAIDLDISSESSIKAAASDLAHGLMQWYTGNQTGGIPGMLPYPPYYWWESGAMWGTLMDYYYYTGDDTYNDNIIQGMMWQASPTEDYMPQNQTKDLGNDDQIFWGFAAMTAAEYNFPNPPSTDPQWLTLAEGVWNSQQLRWDTSTCGGGLRWQIYSFNQGYTYKNAPSNCGFINLGARLYAYTGNQTYADWTVKAWDWMIDVGLIGGQSGAEIFDGTDDTENCTSVDQELWSYSFGMMINAAAVMWNMTGDDMWADRATSIWTIASEVFFVDEVMREGCENVATGSPQFCDEDELSFKTYLPRFMAASTKVMPNLTDSWTPYLTTSAQAAAEQCSGSGVGIYGDLCGLRWTNHTTWDGSFGAGQQMSALSVIQSLLAPQAAYPVSQKHGGSSQGDPSAGTSGDGGTPGAPQLDTITTADRVGAGILTAVVLILMLAGTWWIIV